MNAVSLTDFGQQRIRGQHPSTHGLRQRSDLPLPHIVTRNPARPARQIVAPESITWRRSLPSMIDRPGRVQNIQAYCARVETTDEAFVYLALAEAPNGIRTWAAVPLHEIECVSRDELLDARPGDFWTVWTWSDDGRDRLFVEVATPTAPTLQEQVELDDLIERLKLSSP